MTDQPDAPAEEQALPDIFNDVQQEEPVAGTLDTVQFATLYPTGGAPVHLPIDDPTNPPTITDALNAAGLTVGASTQYWVDGSQVDPHTTRLADSMTISAVGNVKGG
jgi:hypothetical protein